MNGMYYMCFFLVVIHYPDNIELSFLAVNSSCPALQSLWKFRHFRKFPDYCYPVAFIKLFEVFTKPQLPSPTDSFSLHHFAFYPSQLKYFSFYLFKLISSSSYSANISKI